MWVRDIPNIHEKELFCRAGKYIRRIAWIPGVEMVAIVNSLSMFATHKNSDIDLFIITKPGTIWFVRLLVTVILWISWVWRHGEDIAANLCLSFWITTDGMNLEDIAIDDDIYLYYWTYHLKPVFVRGDIYDQFLEANSWVDIDDSQKAKNRTYIKIQKPTQKPCKIIEYIDRALRYIFLPKTLRNYERLWRPEGVIISDTMLKFHDQDRRREIRDKIFQKNFDK
jgi:hypothetical protein